MGDIFLWDLDFSFGFVAESITTFYHVLGFDLDFIPFQFIV